MKVSRPRTSRAQSSFVELILSHCLFQGLTMPAMRGKKAREEATKASASEQIDSTIGQGHHHRHRQQYIVFEDEQEILWDRGFKEG